MKVHIHNPLELTQLHNYYPGFESVRHAIPFELPPRALQSLHAGSIVIYNCQLETHSDRFLAQMKSLTQGMKQIRGT